MRREYERREGATEVKRKVEFSKQLNESRLKVLQAQDDAVRAIKGDAQARLGALAADPTTYSALMLTLLIEGLHKLGEPQAKVRCRASDIGLVRDLIPQAGAAFQARYGRPAPGVALDDAHPLPEGAAAGAAGEEYDTCAGGLVVTSADGRIVCSNTLDHRLAIAYAGNLPAVREVLFGGATA